LKEDYKSAKDLLNNVTEEVKLYQNQFLKYANSIEENVINDLNENR